MTLEDLRDILAEGCWAKNLTDAEQEKVSNLFGELQHKAELYDWLLKNIEIVDSYEGCNGEYAHACELILRCLEPEEPEPDLHQAIIDTKLFETFK